MYDRILLPTDGSLGMANAVHQCLHQARLHDATVHVLYVIDVRAYVMLPEDTQQQVIGVLEGEGSRAIEMVEYLAEHGGDPVSVVGVIQEGIPHEVIVQYVDANDIDLVCMGTHGRTGEAQRQLGSIAEAVVRHSPVPVLTARMRDEDAQALLAELPENERPRYIE